MTRSTYHTWKDRYGKPNDYNGQIPRDWWLADWEKQAIIDFHDAHPLEGYRPLTYMMVDADIVSASPATVYRVLSEAVRMGKRVKASSQEGKGFKQPRRPHDH